MVQRVDDEDVREAQWIQIDRSRSELDEAARDIYRQMHTRMETEIRQALYPIQKFDYTIAGERVQNLWPSPIYQGRRLADVWLADSSA